MNGFYPMLNDVHDKAVKDLSLAECALFEHIWRKLIGWQQWGDAISISQLEKETSGSRATILRLLKKLDKKRWIIVDRADGVTNIISIPKCPGIKTRLGVDPYQYDTNTGINMTLVPVSERDGYQCQNDTHNRQGLKTPPKDIKTKQGEAPSPKTDLPQRAASTKTTNEAKVEKKIMDKWDGKMKVTPMDMNRMLTTYNTNEESQLQFWSDVVKRMPDDWAKVKIKSVNGIIAYGEEMWPDYKKKHNMYIFI